MSRCYVFAQIVFLSQNVIKRKYDEKITPELVLTVMCP